MRTSMQGATRLAVLLGVMMMMVMQHGAVEATNAVRTDSNLYVTLHLVPSLGRASQNSAAGALYTCDQLVDAFVADMANLDAACAVEFSSVNATQFNASSCTFQLEATNSSEYGAQYVPCFNALVDAPWASNETWRGVQEATQVPGMHAVVLSVVIGHFDDHKRKQPFYEADFLFCAGVALVAIMIIWCIQVLLRTTCAGFLTQLVACVAITSLVVIANVEYAVGLRNPTVPIIGTMQPLSVDSCYVTLQDMAPWDVKEANDAAASFDLAPVRQSSESASVVSQWPCNAQVFYNPYEVHYDALGRRLPLVISLASSTLVVSTRFNATNTPLVISSTPHQLKASRVYLTNASFFSISANLVSGIGYVGNVVTDPRHGIEVNATSVFVVSGEASNPKQIDVRHVSNPPLFCIGPSVEVSYNASSCVAATTSSQPPNISDAGSSAASTGGNETYIGYSGGCVLSARDPLENRTDVRVQRLTVLCVSFYALPLQPAPISNKTIGGGFERPPELSQPILNAINASSQWASTAAIDDYVQRIEIVTPLLGILMLNSNSPAILRFFPDLLVWFTGFVLQPPFRMLQAVPNHFTCDDDLTIENLVPPAATMITYLDDDDLTFPGQRFALKVLSEAFQAVDFQANTLTSFQLPYQAMLEFPFLRRYVISDTYVDELQRPTIANFLIAISVVLSAFLIVAVIAMMLIFWDKLNRFSTLGSKRSVVESTLKRFQNPSLQSCSGGGEQRRAQWKVVKFLLGIERSTEIVVGWVNGYAFHLASATTRWFVRVFPLGSKHGSLGCFVGTYINISAGSSVSLEEFNMFYRAFCQIFDRVDGEEYKRVPEMVATIRRVRVEEPDVKNVFVRNGVIEGVAFAPTTEHGSSTLFEEDVRQVKQMFDSNNLQFSFITSRGFKNMGISERFLRHPLPSSCVQLFTYCVLFLTPIAFAMCSLFSLQIAQVPYQITGVQYRNVDTAGSFWPTLQSQVTLQFIVVWFFYTTCAAVLLERLLHALVFLVPVRKIERGGGNCCISFLKRTPFLRFLLRALLLLVYMCSCMYSVGYIFLVSLWWILTCFLAPTMMIPFAAGIISLVSSIWGVYKSLKLGKQKLSDLLTNLIEKEVSKFLEATHFVLGDEGVSVVQEANAEDRSKCIASSTQLPLQVVDYALNTSACAKRRGDLVKLLAPTASQELCTLMTFASGTATDVDDVTPFVRPFVDCLIAARTSDTAKPPTHLVHDKEIVAQANLLVALVKALLMPQSSNESRTNEDVIRKAIMDLWGVSVTAHIDDAAAAGAARHNLSALRQLVAGTTAFLQSRRLRPFCLMLSKVWPHLMDTTNTQRLPQAWGNLLPLIRNASWLLDYDCSQYESSLHLLVEAFPDELLSQYRHTYAKVEAVLVAAAPTGAAARTGATKATGATKRGVYTPILEDTELQEMHQTLLSKSPLQQATTATVEVQPQLDGNEGDETAMGLFAAHAGLYKSLDNVATKGLAWVLDPEDNTGAAAWSELPSERERDDDSVQQQWVRSMHRGKEWPTLDVTRLLHSLNDNEQEIVRTYSLAGINPGSFSKLMHGWQSSSSQSVRQRELRCAGAWLATMKGCATTDIKYCLEAYYYRILTDKRTHRIDNGMRLLVEDCIRVSCPLLSNWLRSKPREWSSTSLLDFLASNRLDCKQLGAFWDAVDAPSLASEPNNCLPLCRKHRTPLHILGNPPHLTSDSELQELRQSTGLLVSVGPKGHYATGRQPTAMDAVCTVSLMQSAAPMSSLETLTQAFPPRGRGKDQLLPHDFLQNYSPSEFAFLPLCGIMTVVAGASLESAESKVRTCAIIAAAVKRSEPLCAAVAVLLNQDRAAMDCPMVAKLAALAMKPLATSTLPGASLPIPTLLQSAFSNFPALASAVLRQLPSDTTRKPIQRSCAIVSLIDLLGKRLRTDDQAASVGPFVPLSYDSIAALIDLTVGEAMDNVGVAFLKCMASIAAGGGVLSPNVLNAMIAHLPPSLSFNGVELLAHNFEEAVKHLSSEAPDTYSLLSAVLPLLDFGPAFNSECRVVAFAVAHVVRQHRYNQRAPSLMELFRDRLTHVVVATPAASMVADPPFAPMDAWLARLQSFSNDHSVSHLRAACLDSVGIGGSEKSWNMLQKYINVQHSEGKQRTSAISSSFNANVESVPYDELRQLVRILKKKPLFAPLADSLDEQLSCDPDATLAKLNEKLIYNVREFIMARLHMSNSDIAFVLGYISVLLSLLVSFVLLGITAFSNGSTFSSVIGVAFPALGGTFSQYDTSSFVETITEKAHDVLDELSEGGGEDASVTKKQKVD